MQVQVNMKKRNKINEMENKAEKLKEASEAYRMGAIRRETKRRNNHSNWGAKTSRRKKASWN